MNWDVGEYRRYYMTHRWVTLGTYAAVAREFGVSLEWVRRCVQRTLEEVWPNVRWRDKVWVRANEKEIRKKLHGEMAAMALDMRRKGLEFKGLRMSVPAIEVEVKDE